MARHEADREDLIAEATALRQRAELAITGEAQFVVAGLRDDGRLSIYFGPDPVYHFEPNGALRRAFVAGKLYRSQATTLACLTRSRSDDSVELDRRDLPADELQAFLAAMADRLNQLRIALETGTVKVERQVPEGVDFRSLLLTRLPSCIEKRLSKPLTNR